MKQIENCIFSLWRRLSGHKILIHLNKLIKLTFTCKPNHRSLWIEYIVLDKMLQNK